MTPAERDFALKAFADSRERLVGALRGLSREQLEYRPAPDRWSVAENLEHIILVETFVIDSWKAPILNLVIGRSTVVGRAGTSRW